MTEINDSTENITRIDRNDAKELKHWLAKANCQHHYSKFIENGITMDLLPELDTGSLKELGISKLGDRLRLEIAISNLKAENLKELISVDEIYQLLNLNPQPSGSLTNLNNNNNSLLDVSNSNEGTLTQLSQNNSSNNLPISSMNSSTNNINGNTINSSSGNVVGNSASSKDSSKTITFILQDGSTKRVNVTGCFNAQAIKRRVLKKLGSSLMKFNLILMSIQFHTVLKMYYMGKPNLLLLYYTMLN